MERLQKVLARAGVASRRACEAMISAGRVSVNGQVVTELGTKVDPQADVLAVDGHVVGVSPNLAYVMVNKPVGYVSTASDPQHRPTVLDLIRGYDLPRVFPVGRLDVNSEGMVLLTNDGALAQRLTHPRFAFEKEYYVWVDGRPDQTVLDSLRAGVPLDGRPAPVDAVNIVDKLARERGYDQISRTAAHTASRTDASRETVLRIVVHEGRKHQVRRLCEAVGLRVGRLVRVRMGPLRLGDLPTGAARPLSAKEVAALQASASQVHRRPRARINTMAINDHDRRASGRR